MYVFFNNVLKQSFIINRISSIFKQLKKNKIMKTLADFKKRMQVGMKLHGVNHNMFIGRDENGGVIYGNMDLGIREVSIKQTNSFAFKTTRTDGKVVDSWCEYPKASEVVINDSNSITIFVTDSVSKQRKPILTYTFID
jgi:hypothetical protein